ncbi:MAG TPA: hypothetical protein VME22_09580 [Solirubrobacteraceae bacterium]|nr:hypothetical protein [Solirubrobacteraceae bacterium]
MKQPPRVVLGEPHDATALGVRPSLQAKSASDEFLLRAESDAYDPNRT